MRKHRLLSTCIRTCNKKNVKTTIQQSMKLNFSIAANAKGITLNQYIDYEIIETFEAAIRLSSGEFERKVRVGVYELGFVPDLSSMTFGEYVDLDSVCGDIYKDGVIMGEAAHKMMCILYRPIKAKFGKYYDIEPYATNDKRKYEDAIGELTLDHVLNTLLFFSTLEIELYNDSLVFLAKEITEIVKEMKEQQPQMD